MDGGIGASRPVPEVTSPHPATHLNQPTSSSPCAWVRFLFILGELSAAYQPPLSAPGTSAKGAVAGERLVPRLPSRCLMAQGTPRQMPFLPARADPNYLLCGSFCVGTKQPSRVHSDVCKQLLPLISTAMLSKHTFPPAATGTVAKHRLTQFAARGVEVSSQGLFCVCQLSRWEFRSWLGPFPALGSLRDTREHASGSDVRCCQRLPRMHRVGRAHPPQVPRSPGWQGKALRLSPLLAEQQGQARQVTRWQQPPAFNPGVREGTTQLTHGKPALGKDAGNHLFRHSF